MIIEGHKIAEGFVVLSEDTDGQVTIHNQRGGTVLSLDAAKALDSTNRLYKERLGIGRSEVRPATLIVGDPL